MPVYTAVKISVRYPAGACSISSATSFASRIRAFDLFFAGGFSPFSLRTGSLAAYCLEITDVDPIRYGLLFERFLNPARKDLPDMDIDFSVAGRDQVINYVAEKYGRDRVAQIITFSTMAARAAIRDAGRVLDIPYGVADGVAKRWPGRMPNLAQPCGAFFEFCSTMRVCNRFSPSGAAASFSRLHR